MNTYKVLLKSTMAFACLFALPGAQGQTSRFEDRLLDAHNHERRAVGVQSLKWDRSLARGAQLWADQLASSRNFKHSPMMRGRPLHGENIWGGTKGRFTPEQMVGRWIGEKVYFRHGAFPNNSATGDVSDVGHYTQIIWRRTRKVGCGIARNDRRDILVCRYSNPGNIVGKNPLA